MSSFLGEAQNAGWIGGSNSALGFPFIQSGLLATEGTKITEGEDVQFPRPILSPAATVVLKAGYKKAGRGDDTEDQVRITGQDRHRRRRE